MILLALVLLTTNAYKLECDFRQKTWTRQPRLYLSEREVLAPTAHSFSIIVDPTDQVVSKSILDTGSWEPQLLPVLSTFVKEGSNILNLGSQSGLEAIIMGKIAGPKGKMYIFQPFSTSYKIVFKNIEIHGLSNITTIYKMGAGSDKQTLKLWIDPDNTGHSSFLPNQASYQSEYEQIEVDEVDNIIETKRIDFALIDVEMFEVPALMGMKEVLKQSSSMIALIEWRYLDNSKRDEAKTRDLLKWLQDQNFFWYRYFPSQKPCEFGRIEMIDSQELFKIKQEDLLLIGGQADLANLLSK